MATNDVHILRNTEDDRLKRQILRSMRFKKWANEEPGDKELYLKTDEELSEWLSKILPPEDVKEAIDNIEVVADLCNVEFKTSKHYPKFGAEDSNKLLEAEIEKGIKWRFPGGMDEAHKERLKKELPVIESMGYSDYHLIVKDFLEYGRLLGYLPKEKIADAPITIPELESYIQENGWHNMGLMTGPGRGSAVGSLVCYLLGITTLDPLKYNLLFERFLNPERISMPDIDSDFANTIRPKVIQYVQNKYGYNAVCGILTVIKLQPKGAINTAAKYYGLKKNGEGMLSLGDKLSSDVPNALNIAFSTKVDKNGAIDEDGESDYTLYQFLKDKYDGNEDALEILRWAKILEGTVSGFSAHAAGIVISDNDDVSEYLPLRMNEKLGMLTTQCDMVELEDNGLLKFDFLGLKTLDIITETLKAIEETTGIIIDPLTIDLTDKSVYEDIFQKGKTNSVFQFSKEGMRAMLKKFKPESFEDLIILNSMYRPGPLQYIDGVCNVKNGVEEAEYLCPELEPILSKTYAAIVYQEQVMEIFQKLAGYSLGGADQVRRYMSKKKADKLALEREAFINGDPKRGIKGCVANGISKEAADKLFDQMSEFAKYAFNKSHAAAYSYNAYITAWLKKHYPREFFSCALDWAENLDEVSEIIKEAESFGIKIYAPDINLSTKGFSVTDDGIRFGLSSVAGVKDHSNAIIEERNKNGGFRSLGDFSVRCNENKKVVKNLIDSGAFDSLSELNRAQLGTIAEKIPDLVKKRREKADLIKAAAIVSSKIETATSEELIKLQEESGIRVMFEKPCKRATFDKKVADSKKAIEELDAAINNIAAPGLHEDPAEKLAKEHELLGAYVSGNPLDLYPSAKDLGFPDLCDVAEGGSKAYGIVSSLNIKKRKSDGAPMAFFKLEDRTGSIDVCCFTKAYASYGKMLEEGSVVMLTGDINAEVSDDDEEKLKFILKTAVKAERKVTSVFVLQVSGLDAFHVKEEGLSKRYGATENGIPLRVFNEGDGLFYQTKLTVSDRILELPSVRRMKTGS